MVLEIPFFTFAKLLLLNFWPPNDMQLCINTGHVDIIKMGVTGRAQPTIPRFSHYW